MTLHGTSGTAVSAGTPLAGTAYRREAANILPVEAWREAVQYHPWHFWGMKDDNLLKLGSATNAVMPEYAWQKTDTMSRQHVRQAIIAAESHLRKWLNYSVGRTFVEETLAYDRPSHYGHQQWLAGADGRWLSVRTSQGKVRAVGSEAYTAVGAATAVTLSDEDGDTINETFTLTVSTAVTDPDELGVYFASADRLDSDPVGETYRIAPVKIKIAGGVATIKGKAWMLIRPIVRQGFAAVTGLNPTTSGVLATTVDVYRRHCDATGTTNATCQALLAWETPPYPTFSGLVYSDNSRDPAAVAYAQARATVRDTELGEIGVGEAVYDSDSGSWSAVDWGLCRQPDRITIRYEAGAHVGAVESTLGVHQGGWDLAVARFACGELPKRQVSGKDANSEIARWAFDMARSAGANDEQYQISQGSLDNPFGTTAGAIYAWGLVSNLRLLRGISL